MTAAIAMATNVSCNKEGSGDSSKSNGDKDGGQAMVTVMMWAMAMATRLGGNKEGKCKGNKSNGDGNEGGLRRQQQLNQCPQWHRRQQWLWRWQTTAETGGAGNNQQNAAGVSGSSGDSGRGSGDCCSAAAMAGRGGGVGEVTTMRAVETARDAPFYTWPW